MPSETVSEGIAFVPPFLHHGQCGPVDSSSRFSYPKKNGFSAINAARRQTRCNTRPDFSSVPLPASRKIRLTVRSAFPLRKKTVFLQSTVTVANPLQYPSRLLFRASLRKPKNPVDSSPRFSSPKKKTVFLQSTGTAANPFNNRPDFSSVPLPASRKIRLTVRPAFPLRKKTAFLQSTGTAANPLQYPSRLLCPLTINGLPCFV